MAIRVNGQTIPDTAIQYEFDRLVKFYSEHVSVAEIKKQFDALKKKAKEQAIGAKLLIEEAARLDIKVPQSDVDAKLEALIVNAGGRECFENLLKKQRISENVVRAGIEQGRRVDILVDRITTGISDPSEEELQAHFKQHEREYVKSDRAQVQHILITPASTSDADRETAISRLEEIRRRIEEGADFADQAAAYSDCPSGKKTGGSLGWISKGMAVPKLDKAIFSLATGKLSDVIESHLGFHILRKTAQEKGGKAVYSEVAENIRDFLRHAKRGIVISEYVEDLKKKAVIEED
jgi:foldase protein PrsA